MSQGNPNDARPARNSISATQLSELAICQTMVQLNQRRHAPAPSAERQQRLERGTEMHARSEQAAIDASNAQSMPPSNRKGACFIATAVYGPAHSNTAYLRLWRDRALRPSHIGRTLIHLYYKASPPLARWLVKHPRLATPIRWFLSGVVAFLKNAD